jgi:hypothetical protein
LARKRWIGGDFQIEQRISVRHDHAANAAKSQHWAQMFFNKRGTTLNTDLLWKSHVVGTNADQVALLDPSRQFFLNITPR